MSVMTVGARIPIYLSIIYQMIGKGILLKTQYQIIRPEELCFSSPGEQEFVQTNMENFQLDRVSSFPRDLIPGEQVEQEHEDVNHYESKAPHPKMAHPWPDHFYPLQVAMGAAGDDAEAKLVHRSWTEDQLFRHFNIEVRPHVNSLSN
ncbi:hypothetical protein NC653_040522 [Populus alba x Populus x berolinensis]|uniref:Uncharacterized protein n=2 Tax=Populus alba x Populus x berolinensis TaxID=444605 RepID=A0AAD6L7W6_9ROSI|nr:hypothetical protein NC653_040522 [Populus alba x Populus x berolinensis]